jgi:hypothetical protein
MEYLCNTDIFLDKNVIKNIENVSFDRYKRKWHDDLMLNERSKLRTYRLFKNDYFKEKTYVVIEGNTFELILIQSNLA